MSIELFQLYTIAVVMGSVFGIAFIVYRIIVEERERKMEESRVKIHWKDYPRRK